MFDLRGHIPNDDDWYDPRPVSGRLIHGGEVLAVAALVLVVLALTIFGLLVA